MRVGRAARSTTGADSGHIAHMRVAIARLGNAEDGYFASKMQIHARFNGLLSIPAVAARFKAGVNGPESSGY
jgi:hypothetical protein